MRAASVKHVEYEILKGILITDFDDLNIDHLDLIGGIGDAVATKRFEGAAKNLRNILDNMMEKRLKHLPDSHPDKNRTTEERQAARKEEIG